MICVIDLADPETCHIATGESSLSGFVYPLSLNWSAVDQDDNVRLSIGSDQENALRFHLNRLYSDYDALRTLIDLWFYNVFSNLSNISSVTEFIVVYLSGVHWQTFHQLVAKIEENNPKSSITLISEFAAAMISLCHKRLEKKPIDRAASRESAILFFSDHTCLVDITYSYDNNELLSIRINKVLDLPMALRHLNAITSDIQMFLEINTEKQANVFPCIYGFCEMDFIDKRLQVLKTANAFKSLSVLNVIFPNTYVSALISQRYFPKGVAVHLPERDLYIEIGSQRPIRLTCCENQHAHCWKRRLNFYPHTKSDIPFKLFYAIPGSLKLDTTVFATGSLPTKCLNENTIITTKRTPDNTFNVSIESEMMSKALNLPASHDTQASIIQYKPFFQEVKT